MTIWFIYVFAGKASAHADAKMTVEYRASTVTNMDIEDSKIGYKIFENDSKLQYSGNKIRTYF